MKEEKILIIKTGYSEFLEEEKDSRKVSLGDILRTTPILHLYKNDRVIWVTDESAFPLFENNPYIERLLRYDLTTVLQLESEEFDSVINLEKVPGICALTNRIKAWKKYGFRFDAKIGKAEAYDRASEVLTVSADYTAKKENNKTIQELLFEMVGKKWNGEEYVLGYKPKTKEKFDIGLNTQIGQKWPAKSWPSEYWDRLEEKLIKDGLRVSRQDKQSKNVLKDLHSYMDWINSAKFIVSNDSLGLHLGIVLRKKVLGLFGSSPNSEFYFYNRGKAIVPRPIPDCRPCFMGVCKRGKNCMEDISVERVYREIKKY